MSETITIDMLNEFVARDAVAIRGRAILDPAGGPGDKIFPPSHLTDNNDKRPGARYAFETRRRNGAEVSCVLIDSVQSQANRMEEALQALWTAKKLTLPVIEVDLSAVAPEIGRLTSLTAPHRVADALLRDSFVREDGQNNLFRSSVLGKSFSDSSPSNADPLFRVCPTGLVFGIWDSTGPKGGLGAKFARAITSEIVGVGAQCGVKTASRIDPTQIVNAAADIYRKKAVSGEITTWTLDPGEADIIGKDPMKWGAKKRKDGTWKQGEGQPTTINHSNIPPTIDALAGGVTIDYAEHTVVLSLAALRRLGFSEDGAKARVVLSALGLVAILAAGDRGHDLRSRCLLVPRWNAMANKSEELALEVVTRNGSPVPFTLSLDQALSLYEEAVSCLPPLLKFDEKLKGEPLARLFPSPKLEFLISKSRELASSGTDAEEE